MSALIWDSTSQAFKDVETPKIYTGSSFGDAEGKIWNETAQAWEDAWSNALKIIPENSGTEVKAQAAYSSSTNNYAGVNVARLFYTDLTNYSRLVVRNEKSNYYSMQYLLIWDTTQITNGYTIKYIEGETSYIPLLYVAEEIYDISNISGYKYLCLGSNTFGSSNFTNNADMLSRFTSSVQSDGILFDDTRYNGDIFISEAILY